MLLNTNVTILKTFNKTNLFPEHYWIWYTYEKYVCALGNVEMILHHFCVSEEIGLRTVHSVSEYNGNVRNMVCRRDGEEMLPGRPLAEYPPSGFLWVETIVIYFFCITSAIISPLLMCTQSSESINTDCYSTLVHWCYNQHPSFILECKSKKNVSWNST